MSAAPLPVLRSVRRGLADADSWTSTHAANIAAATVAALVVAAMLWGLRSLGKRAVAHAPEDALWVRLIGGALSRTRLFFVVAAAIALVARFAEAPPPVRVVARFLFVVAAAVQGAIWAREIILGYVERRAGGDNALASAIGIIRLLVTLALFAVAAIVILSNVGVNVTGLVAGLGVGGIAIGLAAQGIFSDLFAALAIIFDKPFKRGDAVKFDQVTGFIEAIGLKSTRIRAMSGEQVVVANTQLLNKVLTNLTETKHRRFALPFGLAQWTPPAALAEVPGIARALVEARPGCRFLRCGLVRVGASSFDFEFEYDDDTADYEAAFASRAAILQGLLEALAERGMRLAQPTQVGFSAAPDGTLVMPWAPHDESHSLRP